VKVPAATLELLRKRMEEAAAPFSHRESGLLAVLHAVQDTLGWIPPDAVEPVASFLKIPVSRVSEALSFYSMFHTKQPACYRLQVCRTLTCAVCGAADLGRVIREKLGLSDGEATSDGLFSLEEVECLGACELAPAIRINDEPARGPMDAQKLGELIDLLAREGSGHAT